VFTIDVPWYQPTTITHLVAPPPMTE